MFDRSKLESLRDESVTRIGDTLSYGFPQTGLRELVYYFSFRISVPLQNPVRNPNLEQKRHFIRHNFENVTIAFFFVGQSL